MRTSSSCSDGHCPRKLHDRCRERRLLHRERLGRDRRRERVGNVVGTDVERIEGGKDGLQAGHQSVITSMLSLLESDRRTHADGKEVVWRVGHRRREGGGEAGQVSSRLRVDVPRTEGMTHPTGGKASSPVGGKRSGEEAREAGGGRRREERSTVAGG